MADHPPDAVTAAVAAGAERAGGERRRRRATPLLAPLESTTAASPPVPEVGADRAPVKQAAPKKPPAKRVPAKRQPAKRVPAKKVSAPKAPAAPVAEPATGKVRIRRPAASRRTPGGERLVAVPLDGETRLDETRPDGEPRAPRRPATGPGAHPSMRYPQDDAPSSDASSSDASSSDASSSEAPGAGTAMIEEMVMRLLGQLSELAPMVETVAESLTGSLVETLSRDPGALADVLGLGALGDLGRLADRLDVDEVARWLRQRLPGLLEFARTRLSGDYAVDDFGFDPEFTEAVLLTLLRPLYQHWFRVEVRGVENIPASGGALVVANHAGAVAFDSLMTAVAIHDEHPQHRYLRTLGADLIFRTPVLSELARRGGATLASNVDAERLLSAGELVGVWPEGYKGIGKPYSERYKLQRFGRGGFVSAALRTRTPIVPCAIVGSEEIYPMLGNLPTLARILGLPYLPITPTFPLLGPLGLVPLPSKWFIEFGEPVPTDSYLTGAADDPMLVFDLTDQVRQTIQQGLYSLLVRRQSVFR
jgi:1-acyl-sn-glycerol-3-phosphate acyltransferase